ncbi:MAG: hypothetical protein C0599_04635 [Salinivirgaceae bacterium]|nr:MAG: hypothetical protein C0599_04635 [Salinivirgaceae bacterium]
MKYANKNIMGHPNFKYSNCKVLVFSGAFYLLQLSAQNRKKQEKRIEFGVNRRENRDMSILEYYSLGIVLPLIVKYEL